MVKTTGYINGALADNFFASASGNIRRPMATTTIFSSTRMGDWDTPPDAPSCAGCPVTCSISGCPGLYEEKQQRAGGRERQPEALQDAAEHRAR